MAVQHPAEDLYFHAHPGKYVCRGIGCVRFFCKDPAGSRRKYFLTSAQSDWNAAFAGTPQERRTLPYSRTVRDPPLFPPNRIEDGAFHFEGKICHLLVNQKVQNLHLHGIAVSKPWQLVKQEKHFAELKFVFDETSPEYKGFPFFCEIIRRYELTEQGLKDTAIIRNTGTCNMPLGFGYHTAFPAEGATVRGRVADHKFEINKTSFLPTGRCLEWSEFHPGTSFIPFGTVVDFHSRTGVLKQDDGTEFQNAELVYPQGTIRYITDEKFGFWYTWNAGGSNDFICLEPVSWISNALNLPLPASRSGVRKLAPGAEMEFISLLEFIPNH